MSLNEEQTETLLEWALQWQEFNSKSKSSKKSDFERHKQNYAFRKLAEETFPIHEMKVDPRDINQDLMGIIQDLSFEREGAFEDWEPHYPVEKSIDEDGLVPTYKSKVTTIVRDIGKSDKLSTEFYFPLNILVDQDVDEIDVYDFKFFRISKSDWSDKIQEFIEHPHTSNAGYVMSLCENKDLTYWKAEIESKGPRYASEKFKTSSNLFCAKVNYCLYLWNTELKGASQWSTISEPFAALIAINERPEEVAIVDRDPKDSVSIEWSDPNFNNNYQELPLFEYDSEGIEDVFQNALLEYQRAMTETDRHSSFMTFWRCIEGLSRAGRGEKGEIIDRAKWALKNVKENNNHEFIEEIADQMYDSRNNWVHEPNWDNIWMAHEYVAKYLTDAMIQIYAENLGDKNEDVVRNIFDLSTMEEPQRDEKYKEAIYRQEAIEELRQIESAE
ncbi:hypothetical protein [Natronococcus roseus]|uniref:hypothetical protein n=1 Tax=Natronococcus roseus TaxID=1052014 RepID=UPI00374CCAE0